MNLVKIKNMVDGEFTGYWTIRVRTEYGRVLYEDVHVPDSQVKSLCAKFSNLCAQCIEEEI